MLLVGGTATTLVAPASAPVVQDTGVQLVADNTAANNRCVGSEVPARINAVINSHRYKGKALGDAIQKARRDAKADCDRRFPKAPPKATTTPPKSTTTPPKTTTPGGGGGTTTTPPTTTTSPGGTVPGTTQTYTAGFDGEDGNFLPAGSKVGVSVGCQNAAQRRVSQSINNPGNVTITENRTTTDSSGVDFYVVSGQNNGGDTIFEISITCAGPETGGGQGGA